MIEEMGGFEKLMEMLRSACARPRKRGEDGDEDGKKGRRGKGGSSPFGANGYHPEGIRIGQDKGRHGKAIKVWDKREYKNLDDSVELGTRNIKVALRRLRKFARSGQPDELDIKGTIKETANKGYLDLVMQPERRNTIKVLLFFDIGGSMDSHIKLCEELFSAAKTEFKTHGVLLLPQLPLRERVEGQPPPHTSRRSRPGTCSTNIGNDYKVIFVGDATMSPYEITYPGGSVEHWNEEPGAIWVDRVAQHLRTASSGSTRSGERHWDYTPSIGVMRQLIGERMFPLTIEGLDKAMRELVRG